jgi:hypothetical protein
MAKPTVLELVQDILTEMDSDKVDSISDTVESTSVATILKRVYSEMIDELELPSNSQLISLEGLANLLKPNYMRIPENVERVEWIKYDNRIAVSAAKDYQDIRFLDPHTFVTYCNDRPSTDTTNYQVVDDAAGLPLVIGRTDAPAFWTSFDDEYIVFDSYDVDVDSTLQTSKSMAQAYIRPVLLLLDETVPDLPENLFNVLYIQTLNRCFADLKQTSNPKTERQESRMRVRVQRNKQRHQRTHMDWPDYGKH